MSKWPDDPVVGVLLHDVSAPARYSARNEDRRVLWNRDTHRKVGHTAGIVDVGMNVLFVQHDRLNFSAQFKPLHRFGILRLSIIDSPIAKNSCAMVAVLIHAVTKSHD